MPPRPFAPLIRQQTNGQAWTRTAFSDYFITRCIQHADENKALISSFLLYDQLTPAFEQILNDMLYWKNIDQLTGETFSFFSIRQSNTIAMEQQDHLLFPNTGDNNNINTQVITTPVSIIGALTPGAVPHYPSLLFIRTHVNQVVDALALGIPPGKEELVFQELPQLMGLTQRTLALVELDHPGNHGLILKQLQQHCEACRLFQQITRISTLQLPIHRFAQAFS